MRQEEIKALFDQQAANYDAQWARTAAINHCLYFLLGAFFTSLPETARILVVGAGTGSELADLASRHPAWRFTAVEPSGAMLEVCRQRAEREGFAQRCHFHEGYLDTLPAGPAHDAASCFLVSQFILDVQARTAFFGAIAARLKPGGVLASSDLAADTGAPGYEVLLHAWMSVMAAAEISPEGLARLRKAYAEDVGVLAPAWRLSSSQRASRRRCRFFRPA